MKTCIRTGFSFWSSEKTSSKKVAPDKVNDQNKLQTLSNLIFAHINVKKSKSRVYLLRIMSGNIYVNILRYVQRQAIQTRIFWSILFIVKIMWCVCVKKHHRKRAQSEICVNGNENIFFFVFCTRRLSTVSEKIDEIGVAGKAMNFNALFVLIFYFRKCLNLTDHWLHSRIARSIIVFADKKFYSWIRTLTHNAIIIVWKNFYSHFLFDHTFNYKFLRNHSIFDVTDHVFECRKVKKNREKKSFFYTVLLGFTKN